MGAGLQGKAVLHDLNRSPLVGEIVVGDIDEGTVRDFLSRVPLEKVRFTAVDASDSNQLHRAIREVSPEVVVCMLAPQFGPAVARAALDAGIPFVSSSYAGELVRLDDEARAKGVPILPEMGMDPGIDLLLAKRALAELDEVHGLFSYGAGLPEPQCADNPLKYKITWTFEGVLKAYKRAARQLREGIPKDIPDTQMFREENIHRIDVPGLGPLEAYPNGDAIRYIDIFGLGKSVHTMGRFGVRYPGHCAFWSIMADMGFLDDKPLDFDGTPISPRSFLVRLLSPQLQFRPTERDVVIVLIRAWGMKAGKKRDVLYSLTDYRDLETGLFAMNRTVGYTTSIGAQFILAGRVTRAGVLSPVRDVPVDEALDELRARGMQIEWRIEDL